MLAGLSRQVITPPFLWETFVLVSRVLWLPTLGCVLILVGSGLTQPQESPARETRRKAGHDGQEAESPRSLGPLARFALWKLGAFLGVLVLLLTVLAGYASSSPPSVSSASATAVAQDQATLSATQTALAQAQNQTLGAPVDATGRTVLTIAIEKASSPTGLCSLGCFRPAEVKVKVGTRITWINQSSMPHTVTSAQGESLDPYQLRPAPQIFDSGLAHPLQPDETFTFTVTEAAYTLNPDHQVFYEDLIHPGIIGVLIIVA